MNFKGLSFRIFAHLIGLPLIFLILAKPDLAEASRERSPSRCISALAGRTLPLSATDLVEAEAEIQSLLRQLKSRSKQIPVPSLFVNHLLVHWAPETSKKALAREASWAYAAAHHLLPFQNFTGITQLVDWSGFMTGRWKNAPMDNFKRGNVIWGRLKNTGSTEVVLVALTQELGSGKFFLDLFVGPFDSEGFSPPAFDWAKTPHTRSTLLSSSLGVFWSARNLELSAANVNLVEQMIRRIQNLHLDAI